MRLILFLVFLTVFCGCGNENSPAPEEMNENPTFTENSNSDSDTADDLWLEEVEGEKALAWVRGQNERSLADLMADLNYAPNEAAAIEVLTSKERIPYGRVREGMVYNFWQDDLNVRGLWRRTPEAEYAKENPEWETVLDFDKLAADEGKNWVFKGSDTFRPRGGDKFVCLVALSDGGKDAMIHREFDLESKTFVEGGFETPEAKQNVEWVDTDTLLIGTDWGEDTVTESGYPFVVKRWKRGTPLSEAVEVIRGDKADVAVWPFTLELEDGTMLQCADEAVTFFTSTYWLLSANGGPPLKWPLPPKCSPAGIYKGQLLVTLKQDWSPEGQESYAAGDLVAFSIDEFLKTKTLPTVKLVFHADETQAVSGVSIAKGAVLLSLNENVSGKVLRLDLAENGAWTTDPIKLPGTGEVGVTFADDQETSIFLSYDGFLTPDSLLKYDISTGETTTLKSVPAKFNTDGLKVEQFFATSTDGTKIPYYVIHREDIEFNGTTPTLLYGYGGFQISLGPGYNPTTGRLWLEKGGAYVLANIRGGGEFGPKWHQAGLKLNRQLIYDDFISVGEAIIERGLTSPRHLGIMGGSNGGLLMGVMLNQRPNLWNAVVIQVPLLDMLRYHLLLAGASWVDEYGSPEVPEERAFLEKISPVHNFDPTKEYPVPFFVTSTKDDRVHPGHARKLAKKFEDADLPFFYYENIDGGHSAAANQTERAKRSALEFTYLTRQLFSESGE
ncbi:MAG: prolyl oligopeptidase family serine peptidase [Verrucomicrobiales bacterium]